MSLLSSAAAAFRSAKQKLIQSPQPSSGWELETSRRPGTSLVVGVTGSGKSLLLPQLASQSAGCRVLILMQDSGAALAGWEEAPFWGVFQPDDGSGAQDLELEEVLLKRPAGVFELTLPMDKMTPQVQSALSDELIKAQTSADVQVPLHVYIDEGQHTVDMPKLSPLAVTGRKNNVSLHVCAQTSTDLPEDIRNSASRLVCLRAPYSTLQALSRFGIGAAEAAAITTLPVGHHLVFPADGTPWTGVAQLPAPPRERPSA